MRNEFQYNTTLDAKVNTNVSALQSAGFPTLFLSAWYPSRVDIEVLGISLGNTGYNLISVLEKYTMIQMFHFFIIPTPEVYTATQIKNGVSEQNYY